MTNEIIEEMFRLSPLQKEWKVKAGDLAIYYIKGKNVPCICHGREIDYKDNAIWIPRQEDFQKIYQQSNKGLGSPKCLCKWWLDNSKYHLKGLPIKDEDFRLDETWTILWCLFVHKEVYGLVWEWEEKKWKHV